MAWSAQQKANARLIVAVGLEMGMSSRDILVGLMTAMQESSLINNKGGDRDSAGLFQQRPSMGWGTYDQVTDPIYAARKFFKTLRGVKGRNGMPLWQAAQAVQRSGFPYAYAQWENDARRMMNMSGQPGGLPYPLNVPRADISLFANQSDATKESTQGVGGVRAATEDVANPAAPGSADTIGDIQAPGPPDQDVPQLDPKDPFYNLQKLAGAGGGGARDAVVKAAMAMIGTPYSWGGGGPGGPSGGFNQGSGIVGFDCSALVQYALSKVGIKAPRVTYDQVNMGQRADIKSLAPGDLVFNQSLGHVAIYIGNGQMIEAPYTGSHVKISKVRPGMFGVKLNIAGTGTAVPGAAADSKTSVDDILQGAAAAETPELQNVPGIDAALPGGI